MINTNRRGFMKSVAGAATVPVSSSLLGSLLLMEEVAAATCPADSVSYKALVCVYLAGGNDAFNTVIYNDDPDDAGSNRKTYETFRANLQQPVAQVRPLGAALGFPAMALHKNLSFLAPRVGTEDLPLASTYGAKVAVVGSVGPLVVPSTTRSLLVNDELYPPKIYSHNDQTSMWLTGKLEGQGNGWGGAVIRETEACAEGMGFRAISVGQSSAFCQASDEGGSNPVTNFVANILSGAEKAGDGPYHREIPAPQVPLGNADTPEMETNRFIAVVNGLRTNAATMPRLESLYSERVNRALADADYLRGTSGGGRKLQLTYTGDKGLSAQLQMVANFIRSQADIGVRRQVFFVQLGGFDTHAGQQRAHDDLMLALNNALEDFYKNLKGTGTQPDLVSQVTTFTASEFGRKLKENGDGTDHGWAGHHFVVGGAVTAGLYGAFPPLTLEEGVLTNEKFLPDGTLIPSVSVDQYAWELAKWLGVPNDPDVRKRILPEYFEPESSASGETVPLSFMAS